MLLHDIDGGSLIYKSVEDATEIIERTAPNNYQIQHNMNRTQRK